MNEAETRAEHIDPVRAGGIEKIVAAQGL